MSMARKENSLVVDKNTLRAMISTGCDREMAAKGVGWTMERLREILGDDPEFAEELLRAEGQAEYHRMRNLHNATKEEKHWRAATWWLERRARSRYARQSRALTTVEIQELVDEMVDMVFLDVTREADRERLVTSLAEFALALERGAGGQPPEGLFGLEDNRPREPRGAHEL